MEKLEIALKEINFKLSYDERKDLNNILKGISQDIDIHKALSFKNLKDYGVKASKLTTPLCAGCEVIFGLKKQLDYKEDEICRCLEKMALKGLMK